jgi:hypothetical protein
VNVATLHTDAENARRCLRGELLAEELTVSARELAVTWLHRQRLTDAQIGARVGLSTYTAARIRARLHLPAHKACPEVVSRGA